MWYNTECTTPVVILAVNEGKQERVTVNTCLVVCISLS